MKLQNIMIIFLIIILPITMITSYYVGLQQDTIKTQTDYNYKMLLSTKQAIEAYEVNTVEWNAEYSRYADSKRRDILASINVFTTSFANSLNISGTTKDSLQTFIPAIMYNLYDGYYIYAPTYVPKVRTNSDGNALDINGNLIIDNPDSEIAYIKKNEGSPALGGQQYTTNIDEAEKEYKHILKSYISYSEKTSDLIANKETVINYTLDNYIKIYTKTEERSGYLINYSSNILKNDANPETLSENVYDSKTGILKQYGYLYSANKEKIYYGQDELSDNGYRFFKVVNDKIAYFPINCDVNGYNTVYKKITLLNTDGTTTTDLYQILNGNSSTIGKVYEYHEADGKYIETSTDDFSWLDSYKENVTLDYSAVNYYNEAVAFSKWAATLGIDFLKADNNNDPEDENSLFNEHKHEIMKESIINNLNLAISSYSAHSDYQYSLPIFTYDDWNKILNNISMTVFVQGIPIGLKYYNNYATAVSTKNNEHVNPEEIYYISDVDEYYHKKDCYVMNINNDNISIKGYRVTDFIEKAANDGNYRYYKHVGQDGSISSQACYYCAITNNRITYSEKLSQILNGECEGSISTLLQQIRKYQSEYNIAIARERYVQKKY